MPKPSYHVADIFVPIPEIYRVDIKSIINENRSEPQVGKVCDQEHNLNSGFSF